MLAQFGGSDLFEAEEVELDGCPAQFAIQRLDDLQNALGPVEVPPAHGSYADDWKA